MGWTANCNVSYNVNIVPQYESGGTWHRATKNGSPTGILMGPYSLEVMQMIIFSRALTRLLIAPSIGVVLMECSMPPLEMVL